MGHSLTQHKKNLCSSQSDFANPCKKLVQYILMMTVVSGLVACGGVQDQDLRTYVQEVKAREKGQIAPLPEPQQFEIFDYNEAKLRDPFIPTQVIEAAENAESGPRPDTKRVKDVLEEFALGSLKLMGSMEKGGQMWALLRAPDGTLHRTTQGRHMGQNHGEILKITESQLEIKEFVPDGLGGWIERFSTLTVSE